MGDPNSPSLRMFPQSLYQEFGWKWLEHISTIEKEVVKTKFFNKMWLRHCFHELQLASSSPAPLILSFVRNDSRLMEEVELASFL